MDQDIALHLRHFYQTRQGRMVRRSITKDICALWPDGHKQMIAGFGYSAPYLRALISPQQGRGLNIYNGSTYAQHKPDAASCVAHSGFLPLRPELLDKALLIHHLEFSTKTKALLTELWHVLKPRGRAIIIVPNRHGFWAKAEKTPFGRGTPFSQSQILYYLKDAGFVVRRVKKSLFCPPLPLASLMRAFPFMNEVARYVLPFLGGVHLIEIEKVVPAPKAVKTRFAPKITWGVVTPQPSA